MPNSTFGSPQQAVQALRAALSNLSSQIHPRLNKPFFILIILQEGPIAGNLVEFQVGEGKLENLEGAAAEVKNHILSGHPLPHYQSLACDLSVVGISDGMLCTIGAIIAEGSLSAEEIHSLKSLSNLVSMQLLRGKEANAALRISHALGKVFQSINALESYMQVLARHTIVADFACCWLEDEEGEYKTQSGLNLKSGLGIASTSADDQVCILARDLLGTVKVDNKELSSYHREFLETNNLNSGVFAPFKLHYESRKGTIGFYFHRPNGCTATDKQIAIHLSNYFAQVADSIMYRTALTELAEKRSSAFQVLTDISGLLHDVENTCTSLDGFVSSVVSDPRNSAAHLESVQSALDKLFSLTKGAKLVQQNLVNATRGRKQKKARIERRMSTEVVDYLRDQHLQVATLHGIKFSPRTTESFYIYCNQIALSRILDNLVNNAFAAVQANSQGENPRVSVEIGKESGGLTVKVSDNGAGFDSNESRRRAFEPFYSTKPGGWGLGLAICSDLAKSLGGRIESTSTWGRGTTFIVKLPVLERGKK